MIIYILELISQNKCFDFELHFRACKICSQVIDNVKINSQIVSMKLLRLYLINCTHIWWKSINDTTNGSRIKEPVKIWEQLILGFNFQYFIAKMFNDLEFILYCKVYNLKIKLKKYFLKFTLAIIKKILYFKELSVFFT